MSYYDMKVMRAIEPYLSDYEKGVLKGYDYVVIDLENRRYDYECTAGLNLTTIEQIEYEEKKEAYDEAIEYIKGQRDEMLVAFCDNSPYYVDEKGNVVKDE